jgi:hypothetical protein
MRRLLFTLVATMALSSGALSSGGALAEDAARSGYDLGDFQLRSGQDLMDICTLSPNHPDYHVARAFCLGFMEGAGQLHNVLASGPGFDPYFCAPKGISLDQVVTVYASFATKNPQYMNERAIDSLVRAVANKWPCGE